MGAIDDIRAALSSNNVSRRLDEEWTHVEQPSVEVQSTRMDGSFCSAQVRLGTADYWSGDDHLAFSLGRVDQNRCGSALSSVFLSTYSSNLNGIGVGINEAGTSADGHISAGDTIQIGSAFYGVVAASEGHIRLLEGRMTTSGLRANPNHWYEFTLTGGLWVYTNSATLPATAGPQLAGQLNTIQANYTQVLGEAASHVRR